MGYFRPRPPKTNTKSRFRTLRNHIWKVERTIIVFRPSGIPVQQHTAVGQVTEERRAEGKKGQRALQSDRKTQKEKLSARF